MNTEELIFSYIKDYYDSHGYQPSFREIQDALCIGSLQTVHRQMKSLFAKGYLETDLKDRRAARAFRICKEV